MCLEENADDEAVLFFRQKGKNVFTNRIRVK